MANERQRERWNRRAGVGANREESEQNRAEQNRTGQNRIESSTGCGLTNYEQPANSDDDHDERMQSGCACASAGDQPAKANSQLDGDAAAAATSKRRPTGKASTLAHSGALDLRVASAILCAPTHTSVTSSRNARADRPALIPCSSALALGGARPRAALRSRRPRARLSFRRRSSTSSTWSASALASALAFAPTAAFGVRAHLARRPRSSR